MFNQTAARVVGTFVGAVLIGGTAAGIAMAGGGHDGGNGHNRVAAINPSGQCVLLPMSSDVVQHPDKHPQWELGSDCATPEGTTSPTATSTEELTATATETSTPETIATPTATAAATATDDDSDEQGEVEDADDDDDEGNSDRGNTEDHGQVGEQENGNGNGNAFGHDQGNADDGEGGD